MEMVNIKINGAPLSVPKDTTIVMACRKHGIEIPTLCFLKGVNEIGACRVCVVEVKGARTLVAACVYPVNEGMEIITNSKRVLEARKHNLELVLSDHNRSCLTCIRSGSCELQKLAKDFGVEQDDRYDGETIAYPIDKSAAHMVRDNSKCILCRRCVGVCAINQGVGVIGANDRGFKTHISCAFEEDLAGTNCISCGQCITVCPTGALHEQDQTGEVWQALADPTKHVVVNTAPSVRVTLGECFGMPIGSNVEGKMVAALRRIGFDGVFDTDFSADLTIMEEANEFVERVKTGGVLPMITSCSPGWVKYCEHNYPDFIPNLSTCKSPQQMFGAVTKTYYAEQKGLDPKDIVVVSVMPCTAKKFEAGRDNQSAAGVPDVDISITTRELARMIQREGISFDLLKDEAFDAPLGDSTGAGVIFGATGGVMEAALRTAKAWLEGETDETAPTPEFQEVRGTADIKEATYKVGGLEVNVAVVSGTANAGKLLDSIRRGEKNYHFIEVMACPGGCVNGGGQPIQPASVRNFVNLKAARAAAIYKADVAMPLRQSHHNPMIKKLYEEYLDKPGSPKAHHILHTSYAPRPKI